MPRTRLALLFVHLLAVLGTAHAAQADWPMYGHDAHRSNATSETLTPPLALRWHIKLPQPQQRAWPIPVRNLDRNDFDAAPQPVVVDGVLYLASSTDDCVRAFDMATGKLLWRFVADGPVRFAPQVDHGRVYFAADDGFTYCLDANTGKRVWQFHASPHQEMLVGNGRMISRWPCRSGVLVRDGVLYTVGGMWAAEGVFVWGLDAATGKVIWCNDTSHVLPVVGIHKTFTLTGINPQGALLLDGETLVVPNGRGSPAGFNARTGAIRYYDPGENTNGFGGSWLTIDNGAVFGYSKSFYSGLSMRAYTVDTFERAPLTVGPIAQHSVFMRGKQASIYDGKTSVVVHNGEGVTRKAWGLIKAGSHLVVGGDRRVAIEDPATNAELWHADVAGQPRGLAVVDGNLIVTNDQNDIYCFAPTGAGGKPSIHDHAAARSNTEPPSATTLARYVVETANGEQLKRGVAVLVGDNDAVIAQHLTATTDLHVVSVVASRDTADALRNQLLDHTTLYGSRIHVMSVDGRSSLPFPQYIANLVVVADADLISQPELARIVRPSGGMLVVPGGADTLEAAPILDGYDKARVKGDPTSGPMTIWRGQLPGALDWNSDAKSETRVSWPLRPIWFGGPGPARMHSRKYRGHTLAFANGRYFAMGEGYVIAVDAYNGTELWSRRAPLLSALNADDKLVYLALSGKPYGIEDAICMTLDAATGETRNVYAAPPKFESASLDDQPTWPVTADDQNVGTIAMHVERDTCVIDLTMAGSAAADNAWWTLHFDLRSPDHRFGLTGRDALSINVTPAVGDEPAKASVVTRWLDDFAPAYQPEVAVETVSQTDTQSVLRVCLPLEDLARVAGTDSTPSLGFSASLIHEVHNADVAFAHLFGSDTSYAVNLGWMNVQLKGDASEALPPTSVAAGPVSTVPEARLGWTVPRGDSSVANAARIHPFTGIEMPKAWIKPFGCSGQATSTTTLFTRTGTLGNYDFEDDSGVRFWGGIRPACGQSTITGLGLWIVNEGSSTCECTYNFQTSLAFAPAERRLNEDWAVFFDWHTDSQVRQGAINIGAPGDRRDDDGQLWVGYPRPQTDELRYPQRPGARGWMNIPGVEQQSVPIVIQAPMKIETFANAMTDSNSAPPTLGTFHLNAERHRVADTDRPWLYTTGYEGIRSATIKLNHYPLLTATRIKAAPTLDGTLAKGEWPDRPAAHLPDSKTDIYLAYDDDALHVGVKRHAMVDRRGKPYVWTKLKELPGDQPVWRGASLELFISDDAQAATVHMGVGANGIRYDALGTADSPRENGRWDGEWTSAAQAESDMIYEVSIPWRTLAKVGLSRDSLRLNFQTNRSHNLGDALLVLGHYGRDRCPNFAPVGLGAPRKLPPRPYDVTLHFAEVDPAVKPGDRVFDVSIQGKTVLKGFDITREAGGSMRAISKTIADVAADDALTIEFTPTTSDGNASERLPMIQAIELIDTNWQESTEAVTQE